MNPRAQGKNATPQGATSGDSGGPRSGRRPSLDLRGASRKLRIEDRDIKLTPTELRFVQLLRRHRGHAVSRNVVCAELWGRSGESYNRRLEILVKRLRDKLGVDRGLIRTERGSGKTALYQVDLTGKNERRLPTPVDASDPAWGPILP